MSDRNHPLTPEALLAEAEWVRRLAHVLVRGDDAEDLVQDTWLCALSNPPRTTDRLRGWLATVVYTIASKSRRAAERRVRYELEAPMFRPLPSPEDTVERATLQRLVVDAVLSLDEPYRSTVLLRFFEGLESRAVAETCRVPLETVRTRLKRALATLRLRLERHFPEKRQDWRTALMPLFSTGASTSASKALCTWAAVLSVLGLVLWSPWSHRRHEESPNAEVQSLAPAVPTVQRSTTASRTELGPPLDDTNATGDVLREDKGTTITFRGRVLDSHRFPVSGVDVTWLMQTLEAVNGKTQDDGSFELVARIPLHEPWAAFGSIHAFDTQGRAALKEFSLLDNTTSTELDVGSLILTSARDLRIEVVQAGLPVDGAILWIEAGYQHIPCAIARSGPSGIASVRGIPVGDVTISAEHGVSRGRATVVLTESSVTAAIVELQEPRSLDVLVREEQSHTPIPNAAIQVSECIYQVDVHRSHGFEPKAPYDHVLPISVPPTNHEGRTQVHGLCHGVRLAIQGSAEDYVAFDGKHFRGQMQRTNVSSNSSQVILELRRDTPRTGTWPIRAGSSPTPSDNAVIKILPWSTHVYSAKISTTLVGKVQKEALTVEGIALGDFEAIAEAPDGTVARIGLAAEQVQGGEIVFQPPRTIEVTVMRPDASTVSGVRVDVVDPGDDLVCAPQVSDDRGLVRFERLMSHELVGVYVQPDPTNKAHGFHVGSVDLAQSDGRIEATLPDENCGDVVLRFSLQGEIRLPSEFEVEGGRILHENPARGEAVVKLQPEPKASSVTLGIFARNFESALIQVSLVNPEVPRVIDVALSPSGSITAMVLAPSDLRFGLGLEEWSEADRRWNRTNPFLLQSTNAPGGAIRFAHLRPSRYRVVDHYSALASEVVEIGGEHWQHEVVLDLSRSGWVRGRVQVPPGENVALARVETIIEGDSVSDVGVGTDGSFRARIPGNRPALLRARHPSLVADEVHGTVTVEEPCEGLLFQLNRGARVTFGIVADVDFSGNHSVRVLVFDQSFEGTPVRSFKVSPEDRGITLVGIPAGTYALWIDGVQGHAPCVLKDVALTGEDQDLGPLRFEKGSSIRIVTVVPEGQSPPRIAAYARYLEKPEYHCIVDSNGASEFVLSGLGPGRFELTIDQFLEMKTLLKKTIEVDGREKLIIQVDLR